jgi:hypothetical protein
MLLVLDFTRVKGVIKFEHQASFKSPSTEVNLGLILITFIDATRDGFIFECFEADVSHTATCIYWRFEVFRI